MDVVIIPVVKSLISDIVSNLLDTDTFGHYYIKNLVITGSFLKQKGLNDIFNHLITSEIKKELNEQMQSRIYRLQVNVGLLTSSQYQPIKGNSGTNRRSTFYDLFLRGELRIVASMTYWYDRPSQSPFILVQQDDELCNKRAQIESDGLVLRSNVLYNIFGN